MERLEKYLCVAVAALLLMSGGYVLGRRSPRVQAQAETAVPDTLRIRDTVFKDRPVPVEVRVTDTMLVAAVDTVQVMVRDTVQVMVQVPREVRVSFSRTHEKDGESACRRGTGRTLTVAMSVSHRMWA